MELGLLQHHFGRLDDDSDLVSFLKTKLFRAAARDHTLDLAISNLNDDVRHDVSERHAYDFSFKLVSR